MPDNESLAHKLDRRSEVLEEIQEKTEEKRQVESSIFKQLVKDRMEHYLTINWQKLHKDNARGQL
jgi:hypothetical protein